MAIEDALPPHALSEGIIDEFDRKDKFRAAHPTLSAFKPEEPFDLVVSFQLMRESDSIGFGFDLADEEWAVVEQASYAEAGGKHEAGKHVADALEAWAPLDDDEPLDIYAEYSDGDGRGDVQVQENIEFSDAVYAQYRSAAED